MKTAVPTAFAAALVLLAGCSSDPMDVSYSSISRNLTPELQGLAERPIDVNRNLSVTANQNWRMASGDLGRALYTDHPSRLSPFPVVSTSGLPR
jgi:hypothetical protein